jgi:diguanylate cyclase (GGDEF)-like protein/PAS domain S-box-containing protein
LRVWPFVLLALGLMVAMVFVAEGARRDADRARQAQVGYEHLRARSLEMSALVANARYDVVVQNRSMGSVLPGVFSNGLRVYADMTRTLEAVKRLAPGTHISNVTADTREVYGAGMSTMGKARVGGLTAGQKAADEDFGPALRRLDADIEAARRAQGRQARAANSRARTALFASLAGGMLAMLALTLWLERIRRRSKVAAEVRDIERRSEERIRALVEHSSDVVTVIDPHDRLVRWQAASVHRMLGFDPAHTQGRPLDDLIHPDDLMRVQRCLARCAAGSEIETVAGRLRHADGSWVHVEAIAENRIGDPAIEGLLLSMRDVGERKALEDRLRHQAFHDPLTGLANRVLFEERLAAALAAAHEGGHHAAVLFLDLDDFKTINDSLGHAIGDELLRSVAERIADALRPGDVASRQGGDEFAVLLTEVVDERAALAIAEQVAAVLRPEFVVAGRELTISASLGLVLDPGSSSVEDIVRNADIAMYAAKENGKGNIRIFEDALHKRVMDRLELGAEMPQAIEAGQFVLDFQPIVELATERILGMEALVRWEHPVRGRLSPYHFISLAEETGTIVPLGFWVLREACRQTSKLRESSPTRSELYVSVNVSTKQLRDVDFPDRVARILAETDLPAKALVLELTESLLVDDREEIMVQLERLKALGLRLAVDDFGTGYSVLSYLQEFPIDLLKIDKSFVDDIHTAPDKAKLVAGIVQLSDSLRLQVIAEGIEEIAQAQELRAMHSPLGQGYLFSRPVPIETIDSLLTAQDQPAAAA